VHDTADYENTAPCDKEVPGGTCEAQLQQMDIQWKPLIMMSWGLALFDNSNRLITLSGGYKNLRYLTL